MFLAIILNHFTFINSVKPLINNDIQIVYLYM